MMSDRAKYSGFSSFVHCRDGVVRGESVERFPL
jgi:hypothetical protein